MITAGKAHVALRAALLADIAGRRSESREGRRRGARDHGIEGRRRFGRNYLLVWALVSVVVWSILIVTRGGPTH